MNKGDLSQSALRLKGKHRAPKGATPGVPSALSHHPPVGGAQNNKEKMQRKSPSRLSSVVQGGTMSPQSPESNRRNHFDINDSLARQNQAPKDKDRQDNDVAEPPPTMPPKVKGAGLEKRDPPKAGDKRTI